MVVSFILLALAVGCMILDFKTDDNDIFYIGAIIFTIISIVAFVFSSILFSEPFVYEFDKPVKYELTESEAEDYYGKIKEGHNLIKEGHNLDIYKDNEVIRADMWDVSVNDSENNYVEYYRLSKLKEGRYYFFHWPDEKNYFVFHFSENIKGKY